MKKDSKKPTVVLTRAKSGLDYTIAMDARGNLIAIEQDEDGIAISTKDLDALAVLAQALIDLDAATDRLDDAAVKCPDNSAGGHELTYISDPGGDDAKVCIGCQNIDPKLVLKVHALSKARRARK